MKVRTISNNCCPKPKPKINFGQMNKILKAEKTLKFNSTNKNLLDVNLFF